MRLIRSWPRHVPDGRSYVVDGADRWVMDNCDYRPLFETVDDDVLLLEWDIAVSKEDVTHFAALAAKDPGRVLVAPYRIYYERLLPEPVWAHRRWGGEPRGMAHPAGATPVTTGAATCNLFGLGMVYLPRDLMRACADARWSNSIGDVQFSMWHHAHVERDVPICWDVHPVHLNYSLEGLHL
jgi:hypothetical protein